MTFNHRLRNRFRDALLRLAGDEQMLTTLAEIVVADAPGLMEQLSKGIREKDAESVARNAHALKGLLSSFETGQPTDQLQRIIDAARRGECTEMASAHEQIRPQLATLLEEIKEVSSVRTGEPA